MEVEQSSPRDENENAGVLEAGRGSAMQWEVLAYFAILNIAVGLGSPLGIAGIPITYFLKDNLHLTPVQLAVFLAIGSIPVCGDSSSASSGIDGGARDGAIASTCWPADWPPRLCICS